VVSVTLPPFCPWRNIPWYPLDRRLGGTQNRSGGCETEKILLALPGLELRPLGRPALIQLLYRLRYPGSGMGAMSIHIQIGHDHIPCSCLPTIHDHLQFYLTEHNQVHRGADARIATRNNKFVKNAGKISPVLVKHRTMKANLRVDV
jgi:hypothetical protein